MSTVRTDEDLRMWRAKIRLTQAQAASRFGVSRAAYARWENGAYPRDLWQRWDTVIEAKQPKPVEPPVWFTEANEPLTSREVERMPIGAQLVRLRDNGSRDLMRKIKRDGFGLVKKGI